MKNLLTPADFSLFTFRFYLIIILPEIHTPGTACKGETGYYALAKAAFNALGKTTRQFFVNHKDDAYKDEYDRLVAWADANSESFKVDETEGNILGRAPIGFKMFNNNEQTNAVVTIVAIIAVVSTLSVGGFFFIRKKKNVK